MDKLIRIEIIKGLSREDRLSKKSKGSTVIRTRGLLQV
jgi:hypothetical protein